MDSFLSFLKWKWPKSAKMPYFIQFWPILGPYDPHKSPLYYQRSTLNGSCSPKILHKIVLPEIGFNPIFLKWKWPKSVKNVIFHAILTNFGTIWPTQKPLILPTKYFKSSYSPKILHKIVLPENGFISIFCEVKMTEKCQKGHISCNFDQFWDHMTHSKAPGTTNKVF